MAEITLFQYFGDPGTESGSPFCVKVHRALAFKGLDYEVRNVASPLELKRLNPDARKVPVLQYDGELTTDSTFILEFLEERHPEPSFWPDESGASAVAQLVEDWADESLYWLAVYSRWAVDTNFRPFAARAFRKMPPPIRWVAPKMIRKSVLKQLHGQGLGRLPPNMVWANLERHLAVLAGLLGDREFLVGDRLTAADIAVFAPLRALSLPTAPEGRERVRQFPSLLEWLVRVDKATSNRHTVAFDPSA